MSDAISILFPDVKDVQYNSLSETTCHDLGLDFICQKLSKKEAEQRMIMEVISNMTDNPEVAKFRGEVFDDILRLPDMRKSMLELLDRIQFLKDFGGFKRDNDKTAGLWDLLHRLDEISDYIKCVESIKECLENADVHSQGLTKLKAYIEEIFKASYFAEMKKDIEDLKADTSTLQSVTVGINLNERFEATSVGLVSINDKQFKKSGFMSNFADAIVNKNHIHEGVEWDEDYRYHPIDKESFFPIEKLEKMAGFAALGQTPIMDARVRSTIVNLPEGDGNTDITRYMDKVASQLLNFMAKKLRDVLGKYVTITIQNITALIPEFVYYIRFAEYIEELMNKGVSFCKAEVMESKTSYMRARGIYNMKLASAHAEEGLEIVTNDLDFDDEHMTYILTGANRGGKTTITQAVGILYVLAQGGIYVPGDKLEYVPVDCIYTHFPADEDKTMDLGRLGEECTRFKDMYGKCTKSSLLLLNETFSTTSFEEGYYIARDAVRAILTKGVRTIYNTHMHKLGYDIAEINSSDCRYKAASLIVKSEGGNRSFKVEIAPPEGMSYAGDIARKYGVTYEMLTQ